MGKKGSNPPPPRPPANGQRGINEGTNVRPAPPPPPPAKKDG